MHTHCGRLSGRGQNAAGGLANRVRAGLLATGTLFVVAAIVQADPPDLQVDNAPKPAMSQADLLRFKRQQAQAARADRMAQWRQARKAAQNQADSSSGSNNATGGNAIGSSGFGTSVMGLGGMGMPGMGMGGLGMAGMGAANLPLTNAASDLTTSNAGTSTTTSGGTNSTTGNRGGMCANSSNGQASSATAAAVSPTYNPKILQFAVQNLGKQVGNGQCWTLAADALEYAGAKPANEYVFGEEILARSALPGDILQFESARFVGADYWMQMGYPHHTAILYAVAGTRMIVLNQNVNGTMIVQPTVIDLADLRSGTITFYRALPPDQPANSTTPSTSGTSTQTAIAPK